MIKIEYDWDQPFGEYASAREYAIESHASGRTYREIAEEIGTTKESVRCLMRRTKAKEVKSEETKEERLEKKKCNLLEKNYRALERTAENSEANYTLFLDTVRDAIHGIAPLEIPPPVNDSHLPNTDFEPESIVLQISDLQVGEHIDPSFSCGLSEYSLHTFANRVVGYTERVVRLASIYRQSMQIPEVVLLIQGDLPHNETMRGSAKTLSDIILPWQMMLAVRGLAYIILRLMNHFPKVRVSCVPGNHGRIGRPGEEHPLTNMDYLSYIILKEMLTTMLGDTDRLSISVPERVFDVVNVRGHNFLSVHGDTAKSWLGIPYYGVNRMRGRWQELAQKLNVPFEYLCVAHHHQTAEWEMTNGKVFMNGCWPGAGAFAISQIHSAVPAKQNFIMVHEKRGAHLRQDIFLEDITQKTYSEDTLNKFLDPDAAKWLVTLLDKIPGGA